MKQIAMCGNDVETLRQLAQIIDSYSSDELSYTFFDSSLELFYKTKKNKYDLLFLDTETPGINGLEIAKEIRDFDKNIKIIFLSTSADKLKDSYLVTAYFYILKPIVRENIIQLLDQVFIDIDREKENCITIKCHKSLVTVALSKVEYVEVINKTVFFHMNDGVVYSSTGALASFEDKLVSQMGFVKTHRSYIVNMKYIEIINTQEVIFYTKRKVPISRQLSKVVKDAYTIFSSQQAALANSRKVIRSNETVAVQKDSQYHILLVDDEVDVLCFWSNVLQQHGCVVYGATSVIQAEQMIFERSYDCVILDVMFFQERRFDLCKKIKSVIDVPIIFFSNLTDIESQVQAFDIGGIDYITKDTDPLLFWIKIKARIDQQNNYKQVLSYGDLQVDLSKKKVYYKGKEKSLTSIEFDIFALLAQHPSSIYTPLEIGKIVWGSKQEVDEQTVQSHMAHIRNKMKDVFKVHKYIQTIWGQGYCFVSNERK
ncbi:MAG: response regulator [Coprobacillus sp.]